jgi:hypothetical protein
MPLAGERSSILKPAIVQASVEDRPSRNCMLRFKDVKILLLLL